MNPANLMKTLAFFSFVAILFSPQDTDLWMVFVLAGVIFGIGWFVKVE